ncbi:hypothetical protein TNCV_1080651 [Trichonephila clavipes]|uniref:Uncharacterized protein n=1 Tax=Trichonephila clavipes TaxID=2585209 RepID=A0A8X6V028_TRICX|nr:hypothetical protein TNCV_1080651 [Trichonephila clavipes]
MSSFLVLYEGETRNRWRDGQVGLDVRQGTMAPWARRLGWEKKKDKERVRERERTEGEGRGDERRRQERRRKKRAESGIGVKKTMNAGGVENGI